MTTQPSRGLRRLLALLLLPALLAILLWSTLQQPAPPDAPQAPVAAPQIAGLEDLPALESLALLAEQGPPARRQLDLQHWNTSQGTPVYFMPASELPMLDVRLLFAAGSARDGDYPGLASMTNALISEGTARLDADALADAFEGLGAEFSHSSHRDMGVISLRTLSDPAVQSAALALLREVLAGPAFTAEALERLRQQQLAGLRMRLQSPAAQASEAFWREFWGQHPYAQLPEGTAESLLALQPEQLQAFYREHYSAGNAVLALVGNLSRSEAEALAEQLAAALPAGPRLPATGAADSHGQGQRHVSFASQQAHILIGQPLIERTHPDYPALYVANQMLGGSGFGSRLMEAIREQRGLSYSVSSQLLPMQGGGLWMISLQTRADQAELALEVVEQTLQQFAEQGPDASELARSQRQILGEFPLSTASNAAIVGQLAAIGFHQLPLNHMQLFLEQIQQLQPEQVRDAFRRHLPADQRLHLVLGPAPEAEVEVKVEAGSEVQP